MNSLKHIESRGQKHVGFTEVYTTQNSASPRAVITISFLPQFTDDKTRRVVATILLEKPKEIWTKGEINDITLDIENEVKRLTKDRFEGGNSLNWFYLQLYYIDNIDGFLYCNAGDFSY